MTPRDVLFRNYARTHLDFLDTDEKAKLAWFRDYLRAAYLSHLPPSEKDRARILDVGCSAGYLLHALQEEGFGYLHGVDLSPDDAQRASERVPNALIECADAQKYLLERPCYFDVIVAKAVLEHVEKKLCLEFLQCVKGALREGGIALIDVPNMDWLFASHERYMDFTHEAGFTQESLSQLMRNVFPRVEVIPVVFSASRSRLGRLRTAGARRVVATLLAWAEPGMRGAPIWARSLVAVGNRCSSP